jgi:1-acyl-sn-glycerol-3-phosphate acyltransferase
MHYRLPFNLNELFYRARSLWDAGWDFALVYHKNLCDPEFMLGFIRAVLVFIWLSVCAVAGSIYSLIRFRNINNLHPVAQTFSKLAIPLLGIRLIRRGYDKLLHSGNYVLIANHQHNFDVAVCARTYPPNTITVGKKEVLWIPFFGLIFYASGNLLIDRKNIDQAKETFHEASEKMKKTGARVWLFAEGTRRYGLGLGPFKKGPFHLAIETQTPIQPIVISSYKGALNANRWRTGTVITEVLEPIPTAGKSKDDIEELIEIAHSRMKAAIARIDAEIAADV